MQVFALYGVHGAGKSYIANTLKKDGKRVHIIPAELNIRDRLGALWSVVEDVL